MAEGRKIQLSLSQVAAGAAATASAAVAASFLGVYGTIIGAAIMSVVSTVGTTLYEHTIHSSKDKLKDIREAHVTRAPGGVATRVRAGKGVRVLRLPYGTWGRIRAQLTKPGWWKPVGVVSLLVFAIAIGVITVVETGLGKPMSAAVTGQHSSGGTSIHLAASGGDSRPGPPRKGQHGPGSPGQPGGDQQQESNQQQESGQHGYRQDDSGSAPEPSTDQVRPKTGGSGQEGTIQPSNEPQGEGGTSRTAPPQPGSGATGEAPPTSQAPSPTRAPDDNNQRQPTPTPQATGRSS